MKETINTIRRYHEQTKHRLDAYAKGPEFLDWEHQPDPFRRFDGAPLIELPLLVSDGKKFIPEFNLTSVAALLELSLGLSSWKQFGPDRWALRCNPSSGNLHPAEGYVISTNINGLENGVYHYAPHEHALEQRGTYMASDQKPQVLIGLSSILWREAWKYGERAFRYVQLDVGHAIGAFRYAAKALGLQIKLLSLDDTSISQLLGLNRAADFAQADPEHPDVIFQIDLQKHDFSSLQLPQISHWQGSANSLGGLPKYHWDIIDQVASATTCRYPQQTEILVNTFPTMISSKDSLSDEMVLSRLIKQRRSAQAFSGKDSEINITDFYHILDSLLPRSQQVP